VSVQEKIRRDLWDGTDRRTRPDTVTRQEFDEHLRKTDEFRTRLNQWMQRMDAAMFAQDDDNEHKSPGVMTSMQRLNNHIDAVCTIAVFGVKAVKAVAASIIGLAALAGAVKALGWW